MTLRHFVVTYAWPKGHTTELEVPQLDDGRPVGQQYAAAERRAFWTLAARYPHADLATLRASQVGFREGMLDDAGR